MILAGSFTNSLVHVCSDEVSDTWGCYEPVKKPRWNMPCYRCLGMKGFVACDVCNGNGVVGMLSCPNASNTGTMDALFKHYGRMVNYNILPISGGWLDQASGFVEVVSILPAIEKAWDTAKQEKEKTLSKLKKSKNV